jgi:hypothetical protein
VITRLTFKLKCCVFPDGSLGMPEVQLVDQQGHVFQLHFLMVHHRDRTGSNVMGGRALDPWPADRSRLQ